MMKTTLKKPMALAIGAAIASSMAMTSVAHAGSFSATDLGQGYARLAAEDTSSGDKGNDKKGEEGKCGEGKCGADKKGEEGKCGADKKEA
jgi:uncharacterized low-complexity protein